MATPSLGNAKKVLFGGVSTEDAIRAGNETKPHDMFGRFSMEIGNRRVIFSKTLLIPDGEAAKISLIDSPHPSTPIAIDVTDKASAESLPIKWGPEGDDKVFWIHFYSATQLASMTTGYIHIGKIIQGRLYFAAAYHRVGNLSSVTITFAVTPV